VYILAILSVNQVAGGPNNAIHSILLLYGSGIEGKEGRSLFQMGFGRPGSKAVWVRSISYYRYLARVDSPATDGDIVGGLIRDYHAAREVVRANLRTKNDLLDQWSASKLGSKKLRDEVVLVKDKRYSEEPEWRCDQEKQVRKIRGMNHVQTMSYPGPD